MNWLTAHRPASVLGDPCPSVDVEDGFTDEFADFETDFRQPLSLRACENILVVEGEQYDRGVLDDRSELFALAL